MASSASSLRYTLIALASVLTAPAAFAHAHLTQQNPAANAQVSASPQALTMTFSEGIEPAFSGATLTGPKQEQIKTGKATRNEQDKKQLIIPLAQSLDAGTYTVDWHVVSVDGHKTKGHYTFSVK
ncbi:CopC domain-containing protein YobA [Citrobacter sp. Marseille-Q6884]|uniref:CopC domain-containing protein YobA n=1 Tax=Citrobacter sp. Marseille-Q6884 TaxID=2956786 RepID=UPI0021B39EDF|nr:CopC domain-containing protein YobA [Citrobacter sp. Marseille-Q6884]